MVDALKNFAASLVATAPSPATSGTSLVVTAGQGALFPAPPFNVVCWPNGVAPTASNAEICRVTAVSTDTLTLTRAQEGTTAQSIAVGWNVQQNVTAALLAQFTDNGIGTLTGDVTTPSATAPDQSVASTLATVTTAQTVGDSTHYPIVTTDAKGRVTGMTAQAISGAALTYASGNISADVALPSNTVVSTVTVGTGPYGAAVTPNGSYVYVTNNSSNTVSVIATSTNTVVATITVGASPYGAAVTPNGSYVYVANSGAGTVSVIATSTNTVVATVTVGVFPASAAITPNGSYVYVANDTAGTVSVIATSTNTVVATITVGTHPVSAAVTPNGSYVYVANIGAGTVSVIATSTNTVVATITVGASPYGAAVTPNGSYVYVANSGAGTVSVIATSTNTVVATITVGASPYGAAVTPNGSYVYVTNSGAGTVSVIATSTNTVVATVTVGTNPQDVAVTPNGSYVYVTNNGAGTVSVIATSTNTVVFTTSSLAVGTWLLDISALPSANSDVELSAIAGTATATFSGQTSAYSAATAEQSVSMALIAIVTVAGTIELSGLGSGSIYHATPTSNLPNATGYTALKFA